MTALTNAMNLLRQEKIALLEKEKRAQQPGIKSFSLFGLRLHRGVVFQTNNVFLGSVHMSSAKSLPEFTNIVIKFSFNLNNLDS